jgi:hypothetical protein
MKMINSQIRQFRDSIVAMANASPLPIEIKRLVLAEVYTAYREQSDKVILAENKQEEETE